jgi:hypothetical protein
MLGLKVLDDATRCLPDRLAQAVRSQPFYATAWYPLADYRALHAALQRSSGRGPELARELGRLAALDDFNGIYRVLLSILSPEFFFKRSPVIFNRYFETGALDVTRAEQGVVDARFSGCAGFDRNIWEDALGGCISALEACGAKGVQLTVHAGGGDGDDHLCGTATWR